MNLNAIKAAADRHNLTTSTARLTGGNIGLFISLETIINGTARPADGKSVNAMTAYLNRYKIPYEWRGNYTSLLVQQ